MEAWQSGLLHPARTRKGYGSVGSNPTASSILGSNAGMACLLCKQIAEGLTPSGSTNRAGTGRADHRDANSGTRHQLILL